jgi:hypothetical protein
LLKNDPKLILGFLISPLGASHCGFCTFGCDLFCLNFSPFLLLLLLFPCRAFFLYLFIYLCTQLIRADMLVSQDQSTNQASISWNLTHKFDLHDKIKVTNSFGVKMTKWPQIHENLSW